MASGIHHVAVRVTDLEGSIRFYDRHFGFAVASRLTLANGARIAFLAHPDGGAELELIAGLRDHLDGDGIVHHIAFRVDDVPAAFERLRSADVLLLDDSVQTISTGRQLFSCRGPDGERLQITGG